jgi:WD40 repeat protein
MALEILDIRVIPVFLPGTPSNDILSDVFYKRSGLSREITYLDFRDTINFILLEKAILGEGKGLDWSVKIERDARNWGKGKQPTYSGKILKEAQNWCKKNPSEVSEMGWTFINASLTAQNSRFRGIVIGLLLVIASVTFLIVYAFIQRDTAVKESTARATAQIVAEQQGNIATGRQLASQAQLLLLYGTSMINSGLLSVEAAHMNSDLSAQQALSRFLSVMGNPLLRLSLENRIYSAAINSNDKIIAAGDIKGIVNTWDADTGNALTELQHSSTVQSIVFSPIDNDKVVSAGGDLFFWNATSGEVFFRKSAPSYGFTQALFSEDGKSILSLLVSEDKNTKLVVFDVETGNEISYYEFAGNNALLTAGNQNTWAVITQGNTTQIIDWVKREKIASKIFDSTYIVASINIDDSRIASSSGQGSITVWDANNEEEEVLTTQTGSPVRSMEVSLDKKKIAVGCDDGTILILDSGDFSEVMRVKQNTLIDNATYDPVLELAFSSNGNALITGGPSGTAIVWDMNSQQELARMPHNGSIAFVLLSADHSWAVSGGDENTLTVWRPENGLESLKVVQKYVVNAVSFTPKGDLLIASDTSNVQIWDVENPQLLSKVETDGPIFNPLTFSLDGLLLVSASDEGGNNNNVVKVFDTATGKLVSKVEHDSWVESISMDNKNNLIVSGDGDGVYFVWKPYSGEVVGYLGAGRPIENAKLSPDGKYIYYIIKSDIPDSFDLQIENLESGEILTIANANFPLAISPGNLKIAFTDYRSRVLKVWDIASSSEVFSSNYDSLITLIAFNAEGDLLMTSSRDATIRMWEIPSHEEVVRISLPSPADTIAISPDSRLIAFSYDNIVYAWKWKLEDLVNETCQRLPRNLTTDEWKEYFGTLPSTACPSIRHLGKYVLYQ